MEQFNSIFKWLRKLAKQGNVGAQIILGKMYENGIGVKCDEAEAIKWYKESAKQGNVESQKKLKNIYDKKLLKK
ncbi:MAG: sel1 repeat family protein [Endomicrobium sp.]|nr:sel1 repeat family protein [Endomicrobium sp.]